MLRRFFSGTAASGSLKKTALHDFHVSHGGKMVPFCGWSMPLQYNDMGILASVQHVRKSSGIFDVSHMGQLRISGPEHLKFIERVSVGDIVNLAKDHTRLSLLTNEKGGINDDCMITRRDGFLYMVVNAGCFDKDYAHLMQQAKNFKVDIEVMTKNSLVALQGPTAMSVLQKFVSIDLKKMDFMTSLELPIGGAPCIVTRCGYTGEDGFEISVPETSAVGFTEKLLAEPGVAMSGLGARDALRLEAGLCLYGNDIDETTSPVEANLTWTISKRRKEEGGYLGSDVVIKQLATGVSRKRVGIVVEGAPARDHTEVFDTEGNPIGVITSGAFSPMLKHPIAQAYVQTKFSKIGTPVTVKVRNNVLKGSVVKMPFYPTSYYKAQ